MFQTVDSVGQKLFTCFEGCCGKRGDRETSLNVYVFKVFFCHSTACSTVTVHVHGVGDLIDAILCSSIVFYREDSI